MVGRVLEKPAIIERAVAIEPGCFITLIISTKVKGCSDWRIEEPVERWPAGAHAPEAPRLDCLSRVAPAKTVCDDRRAESMAVR